MKRRRFILGIVLMVLSAGSAAQHEIFISTTVSSDSETRTKEQLISVLDSYDVSEWIFTSTVVIDETSIPHSHPVLTLHTRYSDELELLSTFLHEQIHWHLVAHSEQVDRAIEDLEKLYTDVPVGGREGGRDVRSTYLHLLVNYLEFQAMKQLVGCVRATEVMEFWATDHYTWIYRVVLSDTKRIADVIAKFDLDI